MPPKYAAKRDKVESEIRAALETIPGLSVAVISAKAIPDLLLGWQGVNYLIEVKSKGGKLTPDQVQFHTEWNGQIAVCKTLEEVLEVLNIESS